jgi:hypothetical protein
VFFHHFAHFSFLFLFNFFFFLNSFSYFLFYSLIVCVLSRNDYFELLRWASATVGVAFRLLLRSSHKSIGRFYSTCNLQESNRRGNFSRNYLFRWPGPAFRRAKFSLGGLDITKSQTHLPSYRDWQRSHRLSLLLPSLYEGVSLLHWALSLAF